MTSESIIQVVEDDQATRDSLVALLKEAGYTVRAYARGEDLLTRGTAIEPGCVVSDVRMPGMDGLTLLRRLRRSGSALPLMLITGHGDISMAVAAMKAGAVDFLEKPFEADALLTAVEAAMRVGSNNVENTEAARRRFQKLTAREYLNIWCPACRTKGPRRSSASARGQWNSTVRTSWKKRRLRDCPNLCASGSPPTSHNPQNDRTRESEPGGGKRHAYGASGGDFGVAWRIGRP